MSNPEKIELIIYTPYKIYKSQQDIKLELTIPFQYCEDEVTTICYIKEMQAKLLKQKGSNYVLCGKMLDVLIDCLTSKWIAN